MHDAITVATEGVGGGFEWAAELLQFVRRPPDGTQCGRQEATLSDPRHPVVPF